MPIHIPFTAPKGKARIPPRPIPQSGKPNGNVNHFTFAMCPPQTSKANAKPNEAKPHRKAQTLFKIVRPSSHMHRHTAPKPQTPPAPKAECKSLSEFPPRPKPKPHRAQSPYPTAPKAQSPHDQSLHAKLLSLPPMRRLVCGRIPCAQHNLRIQRLIPITRAYACSSRHIRQPLLHVPCYKLLAIPAQRRHWAEGAAWAPHTWHGI